MWWNQQNGLMHASLKFEDLQVFLNRTNFSKLDENVIGFILFWGVLKNAYILAT